MSIGIPLLRAVVDQVARSGVDVPRFLDEVGLAPALLEDPDARIDLALYDRVQAAALAQSQDPAFGLHMGENASLAAFHLVGHMSAQCRTIREGLMVFFRYHRVVCDLQPRPHLLDEGDKVRLVYSFPRTHPLRDRLRAEFGMVRILLTGRMFAQAAPDEVWFEHETPAYEDEYERIFQGVQRFGMPATGMVFDRALLDAEQHYFDPELRELLRGRADDILRRLEVGTSWAERVHELVATRVVDVSPTVGEVAKRLQVTPRSLRRRLEEEGRSFRQVVDDARADIAERALRETATTIQEAAYRLGFSDVSAFHRAFKRWTGRTPREYRESLA